MTDSPGDWLFEAFSGQLDQKWKGYRHLYSNTKGTAYEKAFREFLQSYFKNQFQLRTKAAVVDKDLKCFELFNFQSGEDEIDIVGTFKQSKPEVVFETDVGTGTMSWVPYDGVAFVCEIKSNLTSSSLTEDLKKLSKIRRLETAPNRFKNKQEGDFDVEEPLRCLIYDTEEIKDGTLHEKLHEFIEEWHILLIVESNTILINTSLVPYTSIFQPSSEDFIHEDLPEEFREWMELESREMAEADDSKLLSFYHGLFHFVMCVSYSTPDPQTVYTVWVLDNLRPKPYKVNFKAKTEFDDSSSIL